MKATKIKSMRKALVARREELQTELDRMATEMQWLGIDQGDEKGGLGNHLAEDGSNVTEQERISTVSSDLQEILQHVNSALGRMDEGSYGVCQRCGKPIDEERLEAFPYVPYCIECQSLLERENALYAR